MFCTPDGQPVLRRHLLPARAAPRDALVPPGAARGRAAPTASGAARWRSSAGADLAALAAAAGRRRAALPGAESRRAAARCAAAARRLRARRLRRRAEVPDAAAASSSLLAAVDVLPERKAREALGSRRASRAARWRAAASTTSSAAASTATASTRAGRVPHFEKMLYDQGQLLRVYTEAWRRSGAADDELLWPVRETADVAAPRDGAPTTAASSRARTPTARARRGGSTSGRPTRCARVLGAERARRVLRRLRGDRARATSSTAPRVLLDRRARAARTASPPSARALLAARGKRVAPGTDRKRVAAWNALAISGLARAGVADRRRGDARRRRGRGADFVADAAARRERAPAARLRPKAARTCARSSTTTRRCSRRTSTCTAPARASASSRARSASPRRSRRRFFDAAEGDLFLTPSDGEPLAHRPRSDHDGATPHSTGLAVLGLLRVAAISGRARPARRRAARAPRRTRSSLERAPEAFPTLARAALLAERAARSVAVVVGAPKRRRDARARRSARAACSAPTTRSSCAAPGRTARRRRRELARRARAARRPPRRLRLPRHDLLAARPIATNSRAGALPFDGGTMARDNNRYGRGHDDGLDAAHAARPRDEQTASTRSCARWPHRVRRPAPRRGGRRARGDGARPGLLSRAHDLGRDDDREAGPRDLRDDRPRLGAGDRLDGRADDARPLRGRGDAALQAHARRCATRCSYEKGYNRVYDTIELEQNLDDIERILQKSLDDVPDGTTLCSRMICRARSAARSSRQAVGRGDPEAARTTAACRSSCPHSPTPSSGSTSRSTTTLRRAGGQAAAALRSVPRSRRLRRRGSARTRRSASSRSAAACRATGRSRSGPTSRSAAVALGVDEPVRRYKYAVRICPEPDHWGGLSGCSYTEGVSWGKFVPEARAAGSPRCTPTRRSPGRSSCAR